MPRIRKEPNRYWPKEEKLRIVNMDEYSKENILLGKYNITNSKELNECKTNLNDQLKDLIRQRNTCTTRDKICLKTKIKRK